MIKKIVRWIITGDASPEEPCGEQPNPFLALRSMFLEARKGAEKNALA